MSREIELIKGWAGRPPGSKFVPTQADVANLLVKRGVARYTDQPEAKRRGRPPLIKPEVKTEPERVID